MHFGPGTTPENTAEFLGMKIDNWYRWGMVMVLSTVYAVVAAWRAQVCLNFKTQQVKALKVDYDSFCSDIAGDCNATVATFALLDAMNASVLTILPILLFTTKQLQFMVPAVFAATGIGTWGTMHYFVKKDGYKP